jgi:phosphoglycerate transport regulatory protein PgtC
MPGLNMFKRLLLLATFWLSASAVSAERLNVMTSYPQPVVAVIQEAFEQAHPEIQLNILWRRPADAQTVLMQSDNTVDVLWMPSVRTFMALKAADKLSPIEWDQQALPIHLGDAAISDPDGYYVAVELAGYGVFYEAEALADAGLAVPQRWQDLMQPEWADKIALPIPSQVGFAPMLIDQLLQAQGWQTGWNQWQQIAANSQLAGSGGPFITESVLHGKALVALTIDFFAATTISNQERGQFIYPEQTAFNPAHIAVMADAQEPEAARQFIDYILSEAGQTVLLHPDLRKLPIRPSVYSKAPQMQNPFATNTHHQYDHQLGLQRREFNAVVFDAAITLPHEKLKQAWQKWHQLQQTADAEQSAALAGIKTILQQWPVTEPDVDDAVLQDCAQRHDAAAKQQNCDAFKAELVNYFDTQYDKALNMLAQLTAQP